MRILVDIPEDRLTELAALASARGEPRAEIIRRAIDRYVEDERLPLSSYFGLWANRDEREDGLAYQDRLRAEW